MRAALLAARSAVAEAQDVRMAAADRAMVALHSTVVDQGEADRLFAVWRSAADHLETAQGRLELAKAAAGVTTVVALPSGRAS